MPRSPQGDVTTHQADDLAQVGYLVFRFDMPGLGDSEGTLPENALEAMQFIQTGGHTPYAVELLNQLLEAYHLQRIILAGHCGGALTAIYAAVKAQSPGLGGVLAFEPDFRMRKQTEETQARTNAIYQELRRELLRLPVGPTVHKMVVSVKKVGHACTRWLVRQDPRLRPGSAETRGPTGLPVDANLQLITAWHALAKLEIPILVVTASLGASRNGFFDYLQFLLAQHPPRIRHIPVEGTNHSFVEGDGERAIIQLTRQWFAEMFPMSCDK
ncbi:MAG TPA: alpha/beta fold hydrolase [Verrucomicrobiae bacterium]|nr:alpha/beta fold hydrolase [Verrucomicrobiae bacterium]